MVIEVRGVENISKISQKLAVKSNGSLDATSNIFCSRCS